MEFFRDLFSAPRELRGIREGIANEADLINRKLTELIEIQAAIRDQKTAHETPVAVPQSISIKPLSDIVYPHVSISEQDPIARIVSHPDFNKTVKFFADNPATERSLMSPNSQALLFALVRNMGAKNVVEIGTYRAATSEAICRALHANGDGVLHTIDPYSNGVAPGIIACWPTPLQMRVSFQPINSMEFFADHAITCDISFVDGNHDYEFALFDIERSASILSPGAFILVDNISQPGPFFAAREFLRSNPAWTECGDSMKNYRPEMLYDRERTGVKNTDFCIIRAPLRISLTNRPYTTGQEEWDAEQVNAIKISGTARDEGSIHSHLIVREFVGTFSETILSGTARLTPGDFTIDIPMDSAFQSNGSVKRTLEIVLGWTGAPGAVELIRRPQAVG